jgi:hypothetical protein
MVPLIPPPLPRPLLRWAWRLRRPVTLTSFRQWFQASPQRKEELPLLGGFLAEETEDDDDDEGGEEDEENENEDGGKEDVEEKRVGLLRRSKSTMTKKRKKRRRPSVLELVGHAADVLAWHAVLFEAIDGIDGIGQTRGLTREEAMALTNSDVIAW